MKSKALLLGSVLTLALALGFLAGVSMGAKNVDMPVSVKYP